MKRIVRIGIIEASGFFKMEELPGAEDDGYYFDCDDCREFAHDYVFDKDTKSFGYKPNRSREVDNIIRYIRFIENKLRLKHKTKFTIIVSNKKKNAQKAIRIKPAYFWRCNKFRRAMFTACLKDGISYGHTKNIDKLIKQSKYFRRRRLRDIFKDFLSGKTVLKPSCAKEIDCAATVLDDLDDLIEYYYRGGNPLRRP